MRTPFRSVPDSNPILVNRLERDKWRRRLSLLQAQLGEIRAQRAELERRLALLGRELDRITRLLRAARSSSLPMDRGEVIRAPRPPTSY
ncbi:MAG: hypothetical protein QXG65_00725 [Thermoplasmata archaeon]